MYEFCPSPNATDLRLKLASLYCLLRLTLIYLIQGQLQPYFMLLGNVVIVWNNNPLSQLG